MIGLVCTDLKYVKSETLKLERVRAKLHAFVGFVLNAQYLILLRHAFSAVLPIELVLNPSLKFIKLDMNILCDFLSYACKK